MELRFAQIVFDSEARTLTRCGHGVHLSPKAFDLLTALIEARPRPVRKSEIIDRLWPDVAVEEANVRNLVAEIREALGDGSEAAIRTLPRIGYAFCGAIGADGPPSVCNLSDRERTFPLWLGENVIGRALSCTVVLDASGVSRRHAKVTVSADAAVLEDLGSKNGTCVNGMRIDGTVILRDGDAVQAGAAVLTFHHNVPETSTTTYLPLAES